MTSAQDSVDADPETASVALPDGLSAIAKEAINLACKGIITALAALIKNNPPLLLSEEEARTYCMTVARSTWQDYSVRGILPEPVKVGGRTFWVRNDLDQWVAWRCPGREVFKKRLQAEKEQRAPGKRV